MKIKKSQIYIKAVSVLLSVAMLVTGTAVPSFAAEIKEELNIATLSDVSYVSTENRGGYNEAFLLDAAANGYQYEQLDSLLNSSFDAVSERVKNRGLKYLLVNGNLTYCGEYTNHKAFAEKLLKLEEETGVNVIVCNGATDINSAKASSFVNGKKEIVTPVSASQYATIYSELGLDIAANRYNVYDQHSAGLSYSVELDGGYRLLVIDASYYEYQNGYNSVYGRVSDKLLDWIKTECTIARFANQTLLGVCSWSFADTDISGASDVLVNGDKVANLLADMGMNYIFTAGTGKNDISAIISDNGNVLYDVQSASLISFPNTFRVSTFNGSKGEFKIVDADEVTPIVSRKGVAFEQPYRQTASLKLQYNNFDLAKYCANVVKNYVTSTLIPGVNQNKTLDAFVKASYGISLTDFINEKFLGGGINIMDMIVIFDASNIMNMLEDIYTQAQTTLLDDENELADLCYKRFKTVFDAQLSAQACTAFLETYGFGNKDQGGTVNDLILSMIVYSKCGNENSKDDKFINDVVKNLKSGDLVVFLADMLGKTLIGDLLFDDILTQVEMKPQYLIFMDDTEESIGYYLMIAFKAYLALHGEGASVTGAVNSVLKDGFFKEYGKNIDEVIDYFVKYYYDNENAEIVGAQLASILADYVADTDPRADGDYDVIYDGSQTAISYASRENFRLPTMLTVTPGNNTQKEAYVTWYTKDTVTGTDIEIYGDKNAQFYGSHFIGVEDVAVVTETIDTERTTVRLNLGFTTVGEKIIGLKQHTMKITGLDAGCTYFLRVGDSTKGWWSETVTVTTAQDSETLSFVHVSDTMGDTVSDFNMFKNILNCAEYLYPDNDFILHTGNYVDDSGDIGQWQKMLDGVSSILGSSYIVPVAGSKDTTDTVKQNFAVGSLLGESEKTGVYYSFDYNIAHITVLDSNCVKEDGTLADEQVEWFKNDMDKTNAKWKIVAIHNPVYTNGEAIKADTYPAYAKQLTELFEKYNIDVVLTGSDGVYYRTDCMQNGEITDVPKVSFPHQATEAYYKTIKDPTGVMYSSLGSSGIMSSASHPTYGVDFNESGYSTNPNKPMFTEFEIYGDTLYLTTYTLSGNTAKKIDSIAIKKGALSTGDVNYDGQVNAADARIVLRSTAQLELLTADQQSIADLNGDKKITAADARLILRIAAKLD